MSELKSYLKKALNESLPGLKSQLAFAPLFEGNPAREMIPTPTSKPSAVLIIIIPRENDFDILFTLRSDILNNHKGQISFPGGRAEKGENPIETALREAREEVGLKQSNLEILGTLTELYVQPSDAIITPVVAWCNDLPELNINRIEVEEVFFIPLSYFINSSNIVTEKWHLHGHFIDIPYWKLHIKTPLWGATAMILNELLDIYKLFLKNNNGSEYGK